MVSFNGYRVPGQASLFPQRLRRIRRADVGVACPTCGPACGPASRPRPGTTCRGAGEAPAAPC